jgi:hypothetical protein
MTGGSGFNIVQPNGNYGAGPDFAKDGTQYAEVAFGDGTVYQDFTIAAANTNISFGGYFSSRSGSAWVTNIEIYAMPANTLVSSSISVQYISQGTKVWLPAQGTITLPAGDYRYVANIPDDANFDAAYVFINCLLPVRLLSFSANLQNNNSAAVQWQIAEAEDGCKYELQRSTDGSHFTTINTQTSNSFVTRFSYNDGNLLNGTYYYRLKMTDRAGQFSYSYVSIVKAGSKEQLLIVYPNPVKRSGSLQLSLQNIMATKIELVNTMGQVVFSNSATMTGTVSIALPASLAAGNYTVVVRTEERVFTKEVVVN